MMMTVASGGQPCGSMHAPAMGPPHSGNYADSLQYDQARQMVRERLNEGMQKRHELIGQLDDLTEGGYTRHLQDAFSSARRAGVDEVDWRVPRYMYCKDPKYNGNVDPRIAYDALQRKAADAQVLETQLGEDALKQWERALAVVGKEPPPLEITKPAAMPFIVAHPTYNPEGDVWTRTLELRTMDEAMLGDVSKPLPRPAVHAEDYSSFREGKYVNDDCPIA